MNPLAKEMMYMMCNRKAARAVDLMMVVDDMILLLLLLVLILRFILFVDDLCGVLGDDL